MPEDVLIALDGSPASGDALDNAIDGFPDASLTILYVIDPFEADHEGPLPPLLGYRGDWYEAARDAAESILDEACERAADRDVAVSTAIEHGRAARTILDYAETEGTDHIVIGEHGRSRGARLLLGDTARRVLRRAPVPVTVVRDGRA